MKFESWLLIGDSRTVAMWSPQLLPQTASIMQSRGVFALPHAVIGGMFTQVNPDFHFLLGGPFPPYKVVFLMGPNDYLQGVTLTQMAAQMVKLYDAIPDAHPVYFIDCPVWRDRCGQLVKSPALEYGCRMLRWNYKQILLPDTAFSGDELHCTDEGYALLLNKLIQVIK